MQSDNIHGELSAGSTLRGSLNNNTARMSGSLHEGFGGTSDYNELENKPSINGVTLEGNIDTFDLGILPTVNYSLNEQDTFIKWIDGKDIWRAIIHLNSLSTTNTVLTNVGIVTRIQGIVHGGSRYPNYYWIAPYNDGDYAVFNRTNSNVLQLLVDSWFVNNSDGADIIVEYTKAQ